MQINSEVKQAFQEIDENDQGYAGAQPPPREVLADVIADRAAAVNFAHNHPSGELQPSDADLRLHEQLTEAGKILGLRVLDHVIVSKKGYYSFQEAGLIR